MDPRFQPGDHLVTSRTSFNEAIRELPTGSRLYVPELDVQFVDQGHYIVMSYGDVHRDGVEEAKVAAALAAGWSR